MHINADSWNSPTLLKHVGREIGFLFVFCWLVGFKQEHNLSLVSKSEETDALVRGQREESTKLDLSSQSNKGNAINAFSKSLYELGLPSFHRVQCCSGLVLNWITRKDRVCLSGWLKPWATGIPSVSLLNCQNLALVTSNCLLFIVIYGQGNLVSFGSFVWEAGLICLFFCSFTLLHSSLRVNPCSTGLWVLPPGLTFWY